MLQTSKHWDAPKRSNNVASICFNAVHLLPKDLRSKYGGAKLVSYPGHHPASVCTCYYVIDAVNCTVFVK